jgi:hypothetical protein
VDLGLYASLPGVVIRIRAVIGPGFLSDIAVDNIELTETYDGTLSFLAWVTQEGIPAGQQGESDTPAGDSIPNLLKYACGLPAMQSYSTPDYMTIATNLPSGQFGIIYYQSKSARDIVLQPIWTYALNANWTALGLDITKTGEDADREVWQAVLTGGDTGFMKLRVTPIDN